MRNFTTGCFRSLNGEGCADEDLLNEFFSGLEDLLGRAADPAIHFPEMKAP